MSEYVREETVVKSEDHGVYVNRERYGGAPTGVTLPTLYSEKINRMRPCWKFR